MESEELNDIQDMEQDCSERFYKYEMSQSVKSPVSSSPQNYEDLFARLKIKLVCKNRAELEADQIAEEFNQSLDCINLFVTQSITTIPALLTHEDHHKVPAYLDNVTSVLQLFTVYLQETSEIVDMTCELFQTLPTEGAALVRNVFVHCKDSEQLYGVWLSEVEGKLKSLFKTCHELQLVYLQLLQNSLVFHLEDGQELDILVKALNTNIEIGELVISLDVKTMAEQWKSFSAICEKYSELLASEDVASNCVSTLSEVVMTNIRSCLKEDQEYRVVLRSMKVTSFLMKIIIKMCQLFRHRVCEDYTQIVRLLLVIKGADTLLRTGGATAQVLQTVGSHVTVAAEPLISELLDNPAFAQALLSIDNVTEDDVIGLVLLHASVMAAILRQEDQAILSMWLGESTGNIVCGMLRLLPLCYVWLGYGLKFDLTVKKGEPPSQCGLFEHLLTITTALAARCTAEQYSVLEEEIVRVLLAEDFDEWTALFAADMLVMLARIGPVELTVDQINALIDMYQRIKKSEGFHKSPQSICLANTLQRLFKTLPVAERSAVYREHKLEIVANETVWQAIGVNNLPETEGVAISRTVFDRLKRELQKLLNGCGIDANWFYQLMTTINLASTCVPCPNVPVVEIVQTWHRCYPSAAMSVLLDKEETSVKGRRWFLDLVFSLCELTRMLVVNGLLDSIQLIQILDVLSSITAKSSSAIKISSLRILKDLSKYNISEDLNTTALCKEISKLFKCLLKDENSIVITKTLQVFKHFSLHTNKEDVIIQIAESDAQIKNLLLNYLKNGEAIPTDLMKELKLTADVKFTHKCKVDEIKVEDKIPEMESLTDNFEMADIDELFNSDEETNKKIKLNCDEVESVLRRLENDASVLEKMKLDVVSEEHRLRIHSLITKLQNIFSK